MLKYENYCEEKTKNKTFRKKQQQQQRELSTKTRTARGDTCASETATAVAVAAAQARQGTQKICTCCYLMRSPAGGCNTPSPPFPIQLNQKFQRHTMPKEQRERKREREWAQIGITIKKKEKKESEKKTNKSSQHTKNRRLPHYTTLPLVSPCLLRDHAPTLRPASACQHPMRVARVTPKKR